MVQWSGIVRSVAARKRDRGHVGALVSKVQPGAIDLSARLSKYGLSTRPSRLCWRPFGRILAFGQQLAFFQVPGFRREASRVWIVSNHHDRLSEFLIQTREHGQHFVSRRRVKIAGRLVGEDQVGVGYDGSRNSHALLLAAGELPGKVMETIAQAN